MNLRLILAFWAASGLLCAQTGAKKLAEADCTAERLGSSIPVVRIGWPDQFIEHGKVDDLRAKYGLSVDGALAQLRPLLMHRQRPALVAGSIG